MMKVFIFLLIMMFLFFIGCENDILEYVGPAYQNAIYIMDGDGNNKEKIIDTDCRNVQFIPGTDKILYVKNGSDTDTLFIANDDGSEIMIICDELELSSSNPIFSANGQFCYIKVLSDEWSTSDIYEFDLINNSYRNLTNNHWIGIQTFDYKENTLVYSLGRVYDICTVLKLNLSNIQLDTLFIVQENTYLNPVIFGETTNEIYFSWSGTDILCRIYKMDIAENIIDTLTTVIYGCGLTYTSNNNLFLDDTHSDIIHIDLLSNNLTSLVVGRFPDFHNELMLFSTISDDYDSEVRRLNLSNMENLSITSHGFKPKYSENGEKIVFIGVEQIY